MFDIIIIGGGLAGLVNAVHLSKAGLKVKVIEKNDFPKHKVCGEYISNEVLPYLSYLGINPFVAGAVAIKKFSLSTPNGKTISTTLPLGGFGISRYTLDNILYHKALANGCTVEKEVVTQIDFLADSFKTTTRNGGEYLSKFVIGAFGKRSNIDVKYQRAFIQQKAPFLGVKGHYTGDFPDDLVALHNFKGGYCGVSKVENNRINICYLTDFKAFKKYRNIEIFQEEVLFKNPHLKALFAQAQPLFEAPITISQVSFRPKQSVENHILMSGDAAGMIHPLCGNGMGMAIHSALLLSQILIQFFGGTIPSRSELELIYSKKWKTTFRKRLLAGRLFNTVFKSDQIFELGLSGLLLFPKLLPFFIEQTHGQSLVITQ